MYIFGTFEYSIYYPLKMESTYRGVEDSGLGEGFDFF